MYSFWIHVNFYLNRTYSSCDQCKPNDYFEKCYFIHFVACCCLKIEKKLIVYTKKYINTF